MQALHEYELARLPKTAQAHSPGPRANAATSEDLYEDKRSRRDIAVRRRPSPSKAPRDHAIAIVKFL